jgi:hypothetical protein
MKHTILLLLTLGLACFVRAGDDHDHGHSHAEIKVPATLAEVRTEIAAQQQKLTETLAARDATAAHAATDVLAACVRAIPGKTQNLDEATLQRVTGMANNAAKAWGQAAHEAEHGDYEKAQREAAKAAASYRLLEARLPKE